MANRHMLAFLAAGFALLTLSSSLFVVDQRERAVLFQLGEIKGTDYAPGAHLKLPFIQAVKRFDGRVLTLDNQTENFLTLEKKNVKVDFFVKWRIADTTTYYRSTGGEELVAMDRLAAIVKRGLLDEFGRRTIQQLVSGGRGEFTRALEQSTKIQVTDLGIEIVDVRVKRIDLPDEVRESVYERMRAERTRVASELRAKGAEEAEKIRAEADREAQMIQANAYRDAEKTRGEGDAKSAETYAKAYGQDPEFYSFYRTLNVYRESWRNKQDVLVLEPKGPFFRYFEGAKP
ncbi:MAG: protease modulator HflC [Gammaproteobacteria bacterium]|nr:protease modulator HflC [Gammaproteobacteria bacterium]